MAISWVRLVIISIILQSCSGIEHTKVCSEAACLHKEDGVQIHQFSTDKYILTKSEYDTHQDENLKHEMGVCGQVIEYVSNQNSIVIYSILSILMFSLYNGFKNNTITSRDAQAKDIEENEFKEPVIYGNRLIYPGDMIRPLDRVENCYGISIIGQSFHTHQIFWLRSKQPIDQTILNKALTSLAREKPFLQQCIQFRHLRLWFKRMAKMKINLTVIKTTDIMAEYKKFTDYKLDPFTGPLWETTLLISPTKEDRPDGRNFQSAIVFSVVHLITDALTNNMICRETVRLYNLIEGNRPIPKVPKILPPPLGDSYPSYNIFQSLALTLPVLRGTHVIPGMTPKNVTENKVMLSAEVGELTEEETANVFAACKITKMTVNSFVATVAAFAFAQTAKVFCLSNLDRLNVAVDHAIDLRRYVQTDTSNLYGCYITSCTTTTKIDFQKTDQFWSAAHHLQDELKAMLTNKYPLLVASACRYVWIFQPILERKRWISAYEPTFTHVMTSNMADISAQLPHAKDNECIEIYRMLRSISGRHTFVPIILTFHTYRKLMHFGIDGNTSLCEEAASKHFFSTFMNIMKTMPLQKISSS